jgi:succinyl-diaminopimelate desuccinylase
MKAVQALLSELVCTPSQARVDDLRAVVQVIRAWLDAHGVVHTLCGTANKPLAIVINPPQRADEEVLVLNACVDTAPVGDLAQWQYAPFAATVTGGWLYGRGSADSKAAVAIFSELARRTALNARGRSKPGMRRVSIVFDCDEHSGRFGGIKAYTREFGFPAHCAIGYPGIEEIVCGSRGFWRTVVTLRGHMGHSGATLVPQELAANKLQRLLKALADFSAKQQPASADFPLGARASVTGLQTGAKTFSVTASKIDCAVDFRLTPAFDAQAAQAFINKTLARIARECGSEHASTMTPPDTWPPYRTPSAALLPQLLQQAAAQELGAAPPLVVCGPSNIGNYLAQQGTQVLSGFGVDFRNIHGPDECVRLATLAPVLRVYQAAVRGYLAQPAA